MGKPVNHSPVRKDEKTGGKITGARWLEALGNRDGRKGSQCWLPGGTNRHPNGGPRVKTAALPPDQPGTRDRWRLAQLQ